MKWLNFLQSKAEAKEEIKNLSFSEAELRIRQEFDKEEENIKEIKSEMNKKRSEFVFNLNEKINVLSLIDLRKRKEHERLKVITLQNLEKYIDLLKRLIIDIEKIDLDMRVHLFFEKINSAIDKLDKNSRRIFERATILIGEELKQTEEVIKIFYKEINQMSSENIKTKFKMKDMEELQGLKESHLKIKGVQSEINNLICDLKKEEEEAEVKIKEGEEKLKLFLTSEKFKEWEVKKENLKDETAVFNKDAGRLKERINLKFLLKKVHGVRKEEELIRRYRDNFLDTLRSDENLVILQMLDLSQRELIGEDIRRIREKDLFLKKESELYIANEEVNNLEMIVKKINFEMLQSRSKIIEEDKKLEKFNERGIFLQENIAEVMERILGGVKIV